MIITISLNINILPPTKSPLLNAYISYNENKNKTNKKYENKIIYQNKANDKIK